MCDDSVTYNLYTTVRNGKTVAHVLLLKDGGGFDTAADGGLIGVTDVMWSSQMTALEMTCNHSPKADDDQHARLCIHAYPKGAHRSPDEWFEHACEQNQLCNDVGYKKAVMYLPMEYLKGKHPGDNVVLSLRTPDRRTRTCVLHFCGQAEVV